MKAAELQAKLSARRAAREAAQAEKAEVQAAKTKAQKHKTDAPLAKNVPELKAIVAEQAQQIEALSIAVEKLIGMAE